MAIEIVILTGAGISAESGLGTFRDTDGLWTKYDLNEVATPEGFARNPELVLSFYSARRENLAAALPNAAHVALARLENAMPGRVLLVTQNVDNLHEQAGSEAVLHMHGELMRSRCAECSATWPESGAMTIVSRCPQCDTARVRPDVVWFGEFPFFMDEIETAITGAKLFVSIGTSGSVYPAAGFVMQAGAAGVATLELNLEASDGSTFFDAYRQGPATEIVPAWVEEVLAGL